MTNMSHQETKEQLREEFYNVEMGIDRKDIADWWIKKIDGFEATLCSEHTKLVLEENRECRKRVLEEVEGLIKELHNK